MPVGSGIKFYNSSKHGFETEIILMLLFFLPSYIWVEHYVLDISPEYDIKSSYTIHIQSS